MTLHVPISTETEALLRRRAETESQPIEVLAARLLEDAARRPSLDEVLRPVREEFSASGMTDDELAQTLDKAKHDLRARRRAG